jgi:hypothetical protein
LSNEEAFAFEFERLRTYIDENSWIRKSSRRHKKAFLIDFYLSNYLGIDLPAMPREETMSRDQIMDNLCAQLMVAFPQEDVYTNNRMQTRYEEYHINRIKEAYGLTFDEFIALPFYLVEQRLDHQRLLLAKERQHAARAKASAKADPKDDDGFPMLPV